MAGYYYFTKRIERSAADRFGIIGFVDYFAYCFSLRIKLDYFSTQRRRDFFPDSNVKSSASLQLRVEKFTLKSTQHK